MWMCWRVGGWGGCRGRRRTALIVCTRRAGRIRTGPPMRCGGAGRDGAVTWQPPSTPTVWPPGQVFALRPCDAAAGDYYTCGIRGDQTVSCWGNSFWGQTDPPDGEFTQISAGDYYTCGIRTDRTVSCWGSTSAEDPPEGEFTALGTGHLATCGLRTDRTITCWQRHGQPLRHSPSEGEYTTLTARGEFYCTIGTDRTITCWRERWDQF